jgi:outer membrane receptor for ferrienterochelin and colicin
MKLYIYLSLAFCCLSSIHSLYGQNAPSDTTNTVFIGSVQEVLALPISKTGKVSVASNVITDQEKQPASVTTISSEQLRSSGARTLSEALMYFVPNYFAVEDQDDVIAAFRGLAADNNSKVLLLINGQNMNTEFFWGPPDAILNSADFEYIEKVEVIRGSGSVTLGQGALLGVINIITKNASAQDGSTAGINATYGKNGLFNASAYLQANYRSLKSFFYVSSITFDGEEMRREGWVAQQGNQGIGGGKVADMGHRLKRTNKGFSFGVTRIGQRRDLYNFYRDRDVFGQQLVAFDAGYTTKISSKISNKTTISYIDDNVSLWSVKGVVMGGTAEQRYGLKSIFNIDELWKNNRLAVGIEYRLFGMGQKNKEGNNFIANVIGTFDASTANTQLVMGYEKQVNVYSFFLEDFWTVNKNLDLFAAFRYDNHPFWGNNITPRLGAIFNPTKDILIRATYQTGFRGAVGLHYSGGYRRDGFLRAENYSKVQNSNIPIEPLNPNSPKEGNIAHSVPESMQSFELAVTYKRKDNFKFNVVGFYSLVSNVIDVGVIYRDPKEFPMVNIGSDVAGDWNGYWYFKNTPGTFAQIGTEITANYDYKWLKVQASYSLVKVASATQEQETLAKNAQSMYLATGEGGSGLFYKAFPEQAIRANISVQPIKSLNIALNSFWYSAWYSPIGTTAEGAWVNNLAVHYKIWEQLELGVILKNFMNEQALYPMTSNAGGPDVSPGTPAWESRTYWATLRLKL